MSKNLLTCQNPRADSWKYIRVKQIPILEPSGVGLREALVPRHTSSKLKLKFVSYKSIGRNCVNAINIYAFKYS